MSKHYRTQQSLAAARLKFTKKQQHYSRHIEGLVKEILPILANPFGVTLQGIRDHLLDLGEVEPNIIDLFDHKSIQDKIIESNLSEEYGNILKDHITRHERAQLISKQIIKTLPPALNISDAIDARSRATKELLTALTQEEPVDLQKVLDSFVTRKAKYLSVLRLLETPSILKAIEGSNQMIIYVKYIENELSCLLPPARAAVLGAVNVQIPEFKLPTPPVEIIEPQVASTNPFDDSFIPQENAAAADISLPSSPRVSPKAVLLQECIGQLTVVRQKQIETQIAVDKLETMLIGLMGSSEQSLELVSQVVGDSSPAPDTEEYI